MLGQTTDDQSVNGVPRWALRQSITPPKKNPSTNSHTHASIPAPLAYLLAHEHPLLEEEVVRPRLARDKALADPEARGVGEVEG